MESIYLYTLAVSPSLGGSRQHKRNKQKQWGFHSVLPAMTRDPAEFRWHCWSNTTHPPPSSTTYESGKRLLDMCVEQELVIGNSFFKKKGINKYTWIRVANGRLIERALMDYVLITKRMVGRLKDCACV